MIRIACLFLFMVIFDANLQAEEYLIRIQPAVPEKGMEATGTIEFHAASGQPLFVRSTLGEKSQFLFRGTLRKVDNDEFEIKYSCQVSELLTDPPPRQTSEGTIRLALGAKEQLVSKLSNAKEPPNFDFKISVTPLNPLFGTREATSGWAVRLVDENGDAVANAVGGLYGRLHSGDGSEWEQVVEGRSDKNGIIRFSEGREELLWLTFYAQQEARKLSAAAQLDPDKIRSDDYKYYTVKLTEGAKRWSKPPH